MSQRYVLEGEWSGYRSSQQRVVHRVVVPARQVKRWLEITQIVYTDNTFLWLRIRPCLPRERVKEIKGYTELLSEAYRSGKKGSLRVPITNEDNASSPLPQRTT